MKRILVLMAVGLSVISTSAQDWSTDGNSSLDPDDKYIGTNDDIPLNFRTDSIQRMRLSPSVTTDMGPLDQYTNVRRNGHLLLSGEPNAFTNPLCRAPFTRLHLIDSTGSTSPTVYAQQDGFRPWQRNGVTFTGNSDQCYAGAKYGTNDNSDLVLQWSDQRLRRPRSMAGIDMALDRGTYS